MIDKKITNKQLNSIKQNTIKSILEKVEGSLFPEIKRERIILYFHERDSKVFTPYESNTDELQWSNPITSEAFDLIRPIMFDRQTPVYGCVRGQTNSIDLKLEKKNNSLIFSEILLNSHESKTIQESSARISILKKEKMSFAQALTTLLCCIITALSTYIICTPFFRIKG